MLSMLICGASTILVATTLFQWSLISPLAWMSGVGAGVFVAVTPFSGALFDRLVAATHTTGTAVFLVFGADGMAYLGRAQQLAPR